MYSSTEYHLLEYDTILSQLAELTHTAAARSRALSLHPLQDLSQIRLRSAQIADAVQMLEQSMPPLTSLNGLEDAMPLLALGNILTPKDLTALAGFLTTCRRMQLYLLRMKECAPNLSGWQLSLNSLPALVEETERCIRSDRVDDRATPTLRSLRRQIDIQQQRMREKLDSLLRTHPDWFMESYVTERGGRPVLPLKKEFRKALPGTVVDASSSGSTLFIEPSGVSSIRDEITLLEIQEQNEVQRILADFSAQYAQNLPVLKQNRQVLEELDFLFACGLLAHRQHAIAPRVEDQRILHLVGARHPLLPVKTCVPLDFFLGQPPAQVGIVITGPNTGGKTVALKTVGLLCLMAQTGLHVPAKEAVFPMLDNVLCDLGDGQSIEQNLSTFSAHVTRWVDILRRVTPDTLVLCDELGSGTDPREGMGLARAMLETLAERGALILATTHYPEIKTFADTAWGFLNASMAFDPETLRPLYRLELGKAGYSCALLIAKRLGLENSVLQRAAEVCGSSAPDMTQIPAATKVRLPSPPEFTETTETAQDGAQNTAKPKFQIGESVYVHPLHRTGIVAQEANAKGEVVVQVAGRRYSVNQKRLSPHLSREELYPDTEHYDLDIVLDTVANRKAKHKMQKRHVEGAVVTLTREDVQKL